jgi:hypothetical protein
LRFEGTRGGGREGGRKEGREGTYPSRLQGKDAVEGPCGTVNVPVGGRRGVASEGGGGAFNALEAGGDEGVELDVGGGHPDWEGGREGGREGGGREGEREGHRGWSCWG